MSQGLQKIHERVGLWMDNIEAANLEDVTIVNGDRMLGSLFDLLHATRYPKSRIDPLIAYTWSRPKGAPAQELGGTLLTLAGFAASHKMDMAAAANDEICYLLYLEEPPMEDDFQKRVREWVETCFGEKTADDRIERGDRLVEEVFELVQSCDYDPGRISEIVETSWSMPIAEPIKSLGTMLMMTSAYAHGQALDLAKSGEDELARVWTKVEKIRAKQAAKPVGSSLPQAWSAK